MDLFNLNLAAFRKRYPDYVNSLENANLDKSKVVDAKNGTPTLKALVEGREVFIHSAYDPHKEACRWAGELELKPKDVLIIFGFGLGYHVTELLKTAPPDLRLIIIEPNLSFIKHAFCHLDLRELIASKNIRMVLGEDIPALQHAFQNSIDLYSLNKVKTASYQPLLWTFGEVYHIYEQAIYDQLLIQYVNISTILYFSFQWTGNFFSNLYDTVMSPGAANLFGKLAGKPAIIVSAGPSLTKQLPLLKKAKNKALILCVGSALRVLLNEGVMPDLIVSVDGGEWNYKHFQTLPEHRIPLVFDPIIHQGIIKEYKGHKFVSCCNDMVFAWMNYFGHGTKGTLKVGPSVANISLDLLRKTGANPIIFVGQDLAYAEDRSHASGTIHPVKTLEELKKEKKHLEVDGYYGDRVLTDRSMYTYLKWFEGYIAADSDTTYINATEGGADISGTRKLPLQKVLDKYCTRETDYEKMLSDLHEETEKPSDSELAELVEKLREARAQIIKIRKSARRGLKKSEQLAGLYEKGLPELEKVDRIIKTLEKVDREIKENQQGTKIAILLFQPFIQALRQMTQRAPVDESEKEKGRRISSESLLLYSGLTQVSDVAEKMLAGAVKKFKNEFPEIQGRGK